MITFYENENNSFVVSRFSCMQCEGSSVLSSSKTCEKLLTETKTKNCEKLLTKKEESLASRSRVVIHVWHFSLNPNHPNLKSSTSNLNFELFCFTSENDNDIECLPS